MGERADQQHEAGEIMQRKAGLEPHSIPAFIAAFTKRKKLSGEEVEEIRRMLDRYEDGEDPEGQALSEQ